MNARLVVAALSLMVFSCGSSSNTDSGSGGGSGAGGGSATGGGTAQATCAGYCTTLAANCTTTNAQFGTEGACLGSCAGYTQGDAGVTSGNSLECRSYHATAAAGGAALHCPHAGPAGDGTCGANCESFCALAMAKCSGTFASLQACTTACAAFPNTTAHYTSSAATGDTFSCRMYHLSVASTDATLASQHCPHIVTISAVCK
jgi:hypothetical protein